MNNLSTFKTARKGLVTLLCIFPFFITNVYQNLTISKCSFFIIVSTICFIVCMVKDLFSLRKKDDKSLAVKNTSHADLCMYLLGIVVIFSTISSDYVNAAITGKAGRYMGLLIWLAFIMAYIFISKFYYIRERELRLFAISFIVMCIFGTIQFIGFDPFYMYASAGAGAKKTFISFIGNINVYGGYLCFGVPLAAYLFCFEKQQKRLIIWGATCFAGIFGLITSNSDSAYLGLGLTFLCLFYIVLKEQAVLFRYVYLGLIAVLSAACFKLIYLLRIDQTRVLTFFSQIITDLRLLAIIGMVLAIVGILLTKKDIPANTLKLIRKLFIVFVIATIAVIVFLIVWFTFINKDADIGVLENYLRLNKHWGSDRGYIWQTCLRSFNDLPLYKKFIGSGPDTLVIDLQKNYRDEIFNSVGFYFDNAHNELLQYLSTIGIWGVLLYLAIISLSIKRCFSSDNIYHKALAMPIIAYFAQSLVNIHQPITTPLFFVFLALAQCNLYKDKCIIHTPTEEKIQQKEIETNEK